MPNDASVNLVEGDRALIIGVGRSGMATAAVLRDRGLHVAAYDDKPTAQLETQRADLAKLGVELAGPDRLAAAASSATIAIVSPGVPLNNAAVLEVQRTGVPVISEIEAAYRIAKAPIIAITGSKGKSTTTALTGHLLRSAGAKARTGGNIGNPLIAEAAAAAADEWLVAEVSSFQLEGITTFRPRISVLLNVSPDHLDRYPSMEEYREAKLRVFANQLADDWFVGSADDAAIRELHDGPVQRLRCGQTWFSSYGADIADVSATGGWILRRTQGKRAASSRFTPVIRTSELKIKGAHNVANAMAGYLAASLALMRGTVIGGHDDSLLAGLRSFEPLAHRLQTVAAAGGIAWIDDSKASNPDAVVRALHAFECPIILIAGGRSKRTDFGALAKSASERAKLVVLIGESAREIGALVERKPTVYADSMAAAVAAAAQSAAPGDVVLLSPGCASFDMFESAEQRGDAFVAAVRSLLGETAPA